MSPEISERLRWAASALVLVVVALIVLHFLRQPQADDAAILIETASQRTTEPSTTGAAQTPTPAQIAVDVVGAVQQPGVYYLPESARVAHAVEAAGGLAPNADRERINLAAMVTDGQQLRVPEIGDEGEAAAMDTDADEPTEASDASGGINVNTADQSTLEQLPGVGPATAEAIIEYREANGPFKEIDDLEQVPRIGPSTIDKFRNQVTVGP